MALTNKFEKLLQGFTHLVSFEPFKGLENISDSDLDDLLPDRHRPSLFLGRYTAERVEEALEALDVLPRLREKGFRDVHVSLDTSDETRHMLRIYNSKRSARADSESLLGETAVNISRFRLSTKSSLQLPDRPYQLLCVVWMLLQNPNRPFTSRRPALPGQKHPGLKISREVLKVIRTLSKNLRLDGVVNCPEFVNNAVLYSLHAGFSFLAPEVEGLLQAMLRDLAHVSLAKGSWAVHLDCVRLRSTGQTISWPHEEQMLPLAPDLLDYFSSAWYRDRVRRFADETRLVLDEEKYSQLAPLTEDGNPTRRL